MATPIPSEVGSEEVEEAQREIDLVDDPAPWGFVVVKTTAKIRRLHYIGDCGKRPYIDYWNFEMYGADCPDPDRYDKRCQNCFRAVARCPVVEAGPQAAPLDSDSSTHEQSDAELEELAVESVRP